MKKNTKGKLQISSSVFENEGDIPAKYTCDGAGVNPPLKITNIPEGTKTLALISEDPDAPKGTYDHWLVWNIPPEGIVEENRMPGISGTNSSGKTGYHPPCPPDKRHRYFFYVYALDSSLEILAGSDKKTLKKAMEGHILAEGSLMGTYDLEKRRKK